MSTPTLLTLEKLLDTARDGALLRFSIGNEHLKLNEHDKAAAYFQSALDRDPAYSAAWKQLGQAQAAAGKIQDALDTWLTGARVAGQRGDKQAAREMTVFAKRMQKRIDSEPGAENPAAQP